MGGDNLDLEKYINDTEKVTNIIKEECANYPESDLFIRDIGASLKKLYLFRDLFNLNMVTTVYHNEGRGSVAIRIYYAQDNSLVYDKDDIINIFIRMGIYPGNYQDTFKRAVDALDLYTREVIKAYQSHNSPDDEIERILENMDVYDDRDDDEFDQGGDALF